MERNTDTISPAALEQALDRLPLSRVHWRVFFLCILMSFLDGFDLQMLALAVPLMSKEYGLPSEAFGPPLAAAIAGLGVGSMIFGAMGDRFGRRRMIVVAAPVIGFCTLGVLTAEAPGQLMVWRFLAGLGFGMVVPNALALVADFMPRHHRVFGMTCLMAGISVGAMAAGLVAPFLAGLAGWHGMFLGSGLIDQSQKITVAARATAEKKAFGHRS